jgi:hypothetical protein
MKAVKRKCSTLLLLFVISNYLVAQPEEGRKTTYIGFGAGFDYGGVGCKVEYLPVKHLGLFAAAGYNLLSVGWNLGATCKFMPDKKVSPNLMAMYGYNAAFKGLDAYTRKYDMTSYGLTVGINLDIWVGNQGNKWSIGLFLPFRTDEFMDNYRAAKADSEIKRLSKLLPVDISFGYNF